MPVLMVVSSAALVILFPIDRGVSIDVFRALWLINLITYLFITLSTFALDPATARRTWFQGLRFPGLISLLIIAYAAYPPWVDARRRPAAMRGSTRTRAARSLFTYVWQAGAMPAAWLAKRVETTRLRPLARPLLYVAGYGPLLCAITADRVRQGAARDRDDVGEDREDRPARGFRVSDLDDDRRAGARFERRLFWRELLIALVVAALIVLRGVLW